MIILGQTAKLFRQGDPPVYVLPDGRFAAQLGDVTKVASTLVTLDKQIQPDKKAISLMRVSNPDKVVHAAELKNHSFITKEGKKHEYRYTRWYLYDITLAKKLKAWEKRKEALEEKLDKEHDAIVAEAVHVDEYNFKEMLELHGR